MAYDAYTLWFTDAEGRRLAYLDQPALLDSTTGFTATRTASAMATLQLQMPGTFDTRLLKRDNMVQVWRAPPGESQEMWRAYFIRKWRFSTTDAGFFINITGLDPLDLLRRRIVAFYAGTNESSQTAIITDDLMKHIVRTALVDSDPATDAGSRAWPNFSVEKDNGEGPLVSKAFAWQLLQTSSGGGVLGNLAKASRSRGNEVFFDVVPTATQEAISFEFRTSIGQPGQDLTDITFSQEDGSLVNPVLEFDYTKEVNYVYAGGQRKGTIRNVQQVYDEDRYEASIYNRCEGFIDARNQTTDESVQESGYQLLEDGRPRLRFTGNPVDTEGRRFSEDWDFGDKVGVKYLGYQFDAIFRAVSLGVRGGKETINTQLSAEVIL